MKRFKKALFIFHRDLRLEDNRGLNEALSTSQEALPVFIFDDVQVGEKNQYRSIPAIQFMIESLEDLSAALEKRNGKLFCFSGLTQEIVKKLIKQENIDAVFSNRDYTPFAQKRDAMLAHDAAQLGVHYQLVDDALLCNPDTILTGKGTPYTIYTAFFKRAVQEKFTEPQKEARGLFVNDQIKGSVTLTACKKQLGLKEQSLLQKGGAQEAHKILKHLGDFKTYTQFRDYPERSTTHLSAHLKFGTISPRQVYAAIQDHKADPTLIKQLYWRDFFTYLAYHWPHVFGKPFHKKYEHLAWEKNDDWFKRWCEGTTGFPLVDAGMRELNTTGYMHNRVRMVVASFLTKDMHIDWRRGERYFAQHLIDYDPCVNNGNWQWAASTGADAQPYFRIFNPWLQQKKFDPECSYIKKWIPELKTLSAREIHGWYKVQASKNGYPVPLLDHAVESKKAKKLFLAV